MTCAVSFLPLGFPVIILQHTVVRQLQQWSLGGDSLPGAGTDEFVQSDAGQKPKEVGQAH